jgi:hypothetical protein
VIDGPSWQALSTEERCDRLRLGMVAHQAIIATLWKLVVGRAPADALLPDPEESEEDALER